MKISIIKSNTLVKTVFITTIVFSAIGQASLIADNSVTEIKGVNPTSLTNQETISTAVEKRCLSLLGNKHVQLNRAKKEIQNNVSYKERAFNTRVGRLSKYNENADGLNCNEKS